MWRIKELSANTAAPWSSPIYYICLVVLLYFNWKQSRQTYLFVRYI
jgi:hypothetical protein